MKYSPNVWAQLKGKNADDLIRALERDGFVADAVLRTERIYRHPDGRRVSIHYHTGNQSYGPKLLKALFKDAGWSEEDIRRLKLVK